MEQFKTLFEEIGDTAAYEILLDNDILDEEVIPDLQPEQLQQLGVGSLGKCMKYLRRLKELVKSVQKNNLPSAAPSVALTLPTPNETASTLGAAVASPPASMPATPRPVVTTPRPVVTTPRPAVSTPSSAVSAISGSPAAEPIASASATAEATVSTPSSSPLFMRELNVPQFTGRETRKMVVQAIGEANWSHSHSRPNYDSVVLKVLRQFPDKSDIFKDASYTEDKDCYNNLPSAAPSVALTLPTPNETASTLGAAVASPPASMPATPRPVVTTPRPVVTTPRPVVTTPRPAVSTPSSAVSAISGSPAAEPIASASATAEATVSTPSSSPLFMRELNVPQFTGRETRKMVVQAIGEANWSHSHSRPNYDSVVLKVLRQFPDKSDIFKDASYTEDKDCYGYSGEGRGTSGFSEQGKEEFAGSKS
ncbi:uncharacterized protein [Watersipora subatra]|uniref:uncharacterized protein n=1 Tax=Watersipora subatra TaxID=2589382 RepID=UPI00355B65A3